MTQFQRNILAVQKERTILVACLLPGQTMDPHDPLGELRNLAQTANAFVVDELIQNLSKPNVKTFIGSGKVKELAERVRSHKVDVVIFDNDLSPSQIGNVEKTVECKVLDRSELILDIFAARAKTYEARLQVELAQLEYTYPRLKAMWSHLERIAGGAPTGIGTRGPGEQQLEVDRRIVQRKKRDLKRELAVIQDRKQREVVQRNRDFFTVGLVGYTNAGKSTLFNQLTDGSAYADDKLFATLSTRTRQWKLRGGHAVMLSDTVGFVRDLPHHLVASFKATLEEAVYSDLLLIVLDISHPQVFQQFDTVVRVLNEIGANKQQRLLLLNKTDLLEHNGPLLVFQQQHPDSLAISAVTGEGTDQLTERVVHAVCGEVLNLKLTVDVNNGQAISFIENRTEVIDRLYQGHEVAFTVRIGTRQLDRLRTMGTTVEIDPQIG